MYGDLWERTERERASNDNVFACRADPVLIDSIYMVGGNSKDQVKFDENIREFIEITYKPIGVATTGQLYIEKLKNLEGVILAQGNPNFGEDFTSAIAQQRFWSRK